MEPFKGLKQPQVTRAVADKGKRPQIPEEASASPDVVRLMEQCWKQDPADRPDGFKPVVRTLASVILRDGDPRKPSAAAVDVTSSSGAKRGGTVPPVVRDGIVRDGVDASSSWSDPASQPAGADRVAESAKDLRNKADRLWNQVTVEDNFKPFLGGHVPDIPPLLGTEGRNEEVDLYKGLVNAGP